MHMTGVFIDTCPNCQHKQEALVGYLSHCQKCGHDWHSIRRINGEPITRWHNWIDEEGQYNDFYPQDI